MILSDQPLGTESAAAPSGLPQNVKVEKTFALPGIAFCMVRGEQPATVLVGMSDSAVHRMDTSAEKVEVTAIFAAKHDSYVTGLVRSGRQLISGSYDGALIWWNLESGEVVRRIEAAHLRWIRKLAITADGSRVASVADDMQTRLWDAETGDSVAAWGDYELKTPHGYPSMLYAVAISPDGRWLATGDRTGRVLVRNLENGEIAATLAVPVMYTWDPKARRHSIGGIRSLAFSCDSLLLAVGGMGKVGNIDHLDGASRIELFRWQAQERLHEIEDTRHKGLVEAIQFGPGDAWLIAAGGDHAGFVSIYNTQDGRLLTQEKTGNHIHDFRLHEDHATITTVGHHQGTVVRIS